MRETRPSLPRQIQEVTPEQISAAFYRKSRKFAARLGGRDFLDGFVDGVLLEKTETDRSGQETKYSFRAQKERSVEHALAQYTSYDLLLSITEPIGSLPAFVFEQLEDDYGLYAVDVSEGPFERKYGYRFVTDSLTKELLIAEETYYIAGDKECGIVDAAERLHDGGEYDAGESVTDVATLEGLWLSEAIEPSKGEILQARMSSIFRALGAGALHIPGKLV